MATRKIRLTLSSTQVDEVGSIIDVDFNGVNLDADVEVTAVHGSATLVKEYTVDVPAGTYPLDITFKNDVGNDLDEGDRNLYIELVEFSNDGIDYFNLPINNQTSNLEKHKNYNPSKNGFIRQLNPDYDNTQPISESNYQYVPNLTFNNSLSATDDLDLDYIHGTWPGDNARFIYEWDLAPITIWTSQTTTFNITFS
jgi:hypothetical protein